LTRARLHREGASRYSRIFKPAKKERERKGKKSKRRVREE
jgi:hypothetical protein